MFSILSLFLFIALVIVLINNNKKMESSSSNQTNQTGNILPGQNNQKTEAFLNKPIEIDKKKYSGLGIFMAVILFGLLVMFGERIIFDLNRLFNPAIDDEYTNWQNMQQQYSQRRGYEYDMPQSALKTPVRSYEMVQDSAVAAPGTQIYYASQDQGRYMMYKLIIHASVIIPLFVLAFVLFYFKKNNYQLRPLLISFVVASFWLMFHLLGETVSFVMDEYKNIAIYVILIVLMAVFGVLAYYSQAKHQKTENAK